MTTASVPHAANDRIGSACRRNDTASVKVYLPRFLKRSASKNRIMGHPTKKPIEYINPSKPLAKTNPDIPKKDAADI